MASRKIGWMPLRTSPAVLSLPPLVLLLVLLASCAAPGSAIAQPKAPLNIKTQVGYGELDVGRYWGVDVGALLLRAADRRALARRSIPKVGACSWVCMTMPFSTCARTPVCRSTP